MKSKQTDAELLTELAAEAGKLAKDYESMTEWQQEQFRRGAKHWTDRGDQ